MKSSLSPFLVLSSLCVFANSQATYPDCVSTACTPLRDVGISCGYDFAGTAPANKDQTKCICGRPNAQEVIKQCLECTNLSETDPADSNSLNAVCVGFTPDGVSSVISGGSVAPTTAPASSVTPASSTTSASDTTNIGSNTANSTSTINSSSEVPSTNLPQATSTSSAAASHMTPVVGFAALLLVAHVGL